jgi:predicted PurR-regulated permease PerM
LKTLFAEKLTTWLSTSLASLTAILVDTFTAAFIGVSALVLSAFFVVRGEHVADSFYELLPKRRRVAARALADELAEMFSAYVSGQVALCAITGSLIYAISAFMGFKFALLLGILSGIAYAIPFVGQVFAHALAILLAAPQGGYMVLWVNLVVFGVARVSDNLLVPKIMSESVGVSPIVVMFAVFAGGELFGLPGLLLGIPAAALAKIAWRFLREGALTMPAPPTGAVSSDRPEDPASTGARKHREA